MVSYDHALEIDPANADAYVAKGAALANRDLFESAVQQFERALRTQPDHPNAGKYLEATKAKLEAQRLAKLTSKFMFAPSANAVAETPFAAAAAGAVEEHDDKRVEDRLKMLLKGDRKRKKEKKKKKKKKDRKHKRKPEKDKKKKKKKKKKDSSSSDSDSDSDLDSDDEESDPGSAKPPTGSTEGEPPPKKPRTLPSTVY